MIFSFALLITIASIWIIGMRIIMNNTEEWKGWQKIIYCPECRKELSSDDEMRGLCRKCGHFDEFLFGEAKIRRWVKTGLFSGKWEYK